MARPRRHTAMPSDFPERAAKESTTALRKHYRVQLDRIVAWRLECGVPSPMVRPAVNEGPPAGFAEAAAVNSSADLAKLYRRTAGTIAQWRRDCGVKAPGNSHVSSGTYQPVPMPENFATLGPTMTRHEAQAFFGHGEVVVKRWAQEAGIAFRKQISVVSGRRSPKVRDTARDMSRAGQAAEFLQKFGPVFRCTGTGAANPKGDHWRRGSTILSSADIIERAERNGWRPDAWKQLSTPHPEGARA
jgi:hypothetical protein